METFPLPLSVSELIAARNRLRDHYRSVLASKGSEVELAFTLDGNLVGDLGEALSAEIFDIKLVETRSAVGIDGFAPDGRTVQVKATGTSRGPAFRCTEICAEHLLFFELDFQNATVIIVFNGPEHYVRKYLPASFDNQRTLTRNQIREANRMVRDHERLSVARDFEARN
jgi:hypothetical protein